MITVDNGPQLIGKALDARLIGMDCGVQSTRKTCQ